MGSRRGQLAVAAAFVVAALGASCAWGAGLRVLVRHTPNKTETNRTAKTIDAIVIHDTEGRFIGSIRALQRVREDASAHFVVSRRGQVVQLVPVTDVAWHAGNSWWNLHSIGIEHEGWAGRSRSYTEAEYRASAQLVAYLAHRWGIPLDRRHIIGHYQVPDPYHPGRFGGFSHHTDPGPYWRWHHYLALVHWYSRHPVLPHFVHAMRLHDSPLPVRATHAPGAPARSVVDRGATVHGKALWWSGIDAWRQARRHIWKVDFFVDGHRLYTDHTWPFAFHRTVGWNSRTVPNGRHMLSVLAYGTQHYRVWKRIPVRVDNPPLRLRVTGVAPGEAVAGVLRLDTRVDTTVDRVVLYADGKAVSRDAAAPYELSWDTTRATEGPHRLLVYARDAHGHRTAQPYPVVVANAPTFPAALDDGWVTHHVRVPGAELVQ
jgi:N-acetylmuramoyl-L-alanine amidase/Bacterial Ig domain